MTKRKAPYTHADGSGCWTTNCSLGNSKTILQEKETFIQEWFQPTESKKEVTLVDVIATQQEFDQAVANDEIFRQKHPEYPYSIYKYSQLTNFKKNWNPITLASRGLIINDETGEIIARPFSKFFNYNEPSTPTELMTGEISVSEKLDGSLGISYQTPEGLQITTAGGFSAEQGKHATKLYREKYEGNWKPRKNTTYMWEIIYPENRIVVNYGDEDDIHLLGAVDIKTGKSIPLSELTEWKWKRAKEYDNFESLDSVIKSDDRENHEGFVVHYKDTDTRVKYKHEEYLRYHKIATGVNARRIWEKLRDNDGASFDDWVVNAPEEFEPYINTTRARIQKEYDTKEQAIRTSFNDFIKTVPKNVNAKEYAQHVTQKAPKEYISHFFALQQKGEISTQGKKNIWESIKPDHEKSFWSANSGNTQSE